MGEASEDTSSTAQARKRRMQRRAGKPQEEEVPTTTTKKLRLSEDEEASDLDYSSSSSDSNPSTTFSKDALAKIPGVKKQARYVPAVNMSKADLTLWRKEARRVRNRESAAASRQKTQKRIAELEDEVGTVTKKYEAALRRIVELEAAAAAGNASNAWMPKTRYPQHTEEEEGRVSSPVLQPAHPVSPPLSPRDSFSLEEEPELDWNKNVSAATLHHPQTATTFKISRHNACVKIPNRVVVAL